MSQSGSGERKMIRLPLQSGPDAQLLGGSGVPIARELHLLDARILTGVELPPGRKWMLHADIISRRRRNLVQ